MKLIKISLLVSIIFILTIVKLHGQEASKEITTSQLSPNAIYSSFGLFCIGVNYERLIWTPKQKCFFTSYWTQAGLGLWGEPFGGAGNYFRVNATAITGSKSGHLELSLGIVSTFDKKFYNYAVDDAIYFDEIEPSKSRYRDWLPSTVIGYRFQKPNNNFFFRTGIGIPFRFGSSYTLIDYFHVSTGFCF